VVPWESTSAGGACIIVKNEFSKLFKQSSFTSLLQGRCIKLVLSGDCGGICFIGLHFWLGANAGCDEKIGLLRRLQFAIPNPHKLVTIIAGDFNFESLGEKTFNASTGSYSPASNIGVAKYWHNNFGSFTDLFQDQFTLAQGNAGGFIYSRIDRIYSNHALWQLADFDVVVYLAGKVETDTELSDHVPVVACLREKVFKKSAPPIPVWVATHPHFRTACSHLLELQPATTVDPIDAVLAVKHLFRNAAALVVDHVRQVGAKTATEKLHWAIALCRAELSSNCRLAYKALQARDEL